MTTTATHWVPARFRNLDEEQIGLIQCRLIDLHHRAVDVAKDYGISSATVYRVKNAVPAELVTIEEEALRKIRERANKNLGRKKRKMRRVA